MDQEYFKDKYRQFLHCYGDITYESIQISDCLQSRLYGFVRERNKYGILEVVKDLTKPFIQVINYALLGTLPYEGNVVFSDRAKGEIPSINDKYVFVLESNPNSSCHKTTLSITKEFDEKEYVVLTSMYRYKKFDQDALQGRLYPIELYVPYWNVNPVLFLKYWWVYVCKTCESKTLSGAYFSTWLLPKLNEVILYVQYFKIILDRSPKAVVNTKEKFPMAATAVHIANRNSIPTFFVEHSMTKKGKNFTYNYPLISDYVMVYGRTSKTWYLKRGVEADRVIISGQPRYDELFKSINKAEKNTGESLKSKHKKVRVTLATQPFEEKILKKQVLTVCSQLSSMEDSVALYIKPHPRNNVEKMRNYVPEKSNAIVQKRNESIVECIKKSKCIITFSSNIGLESLALETPIVTTEYIRPKHNTVYCKRNVALCAQKPEEVSRYVSASTRKKNDYLDWTKIRKFVEHRIDKKNGKSSDFVKRMIKDKSNHGKISREYCVSFDEV